jgi:hypothetical protein
VGEECGMCKKVTVFARDFGKNDGPTLPHDRPTNSGHTAGRDVCLCCGVNHDVVDCASFHDQELDLLPRREWIISAVI